MKAGVETSVPIRSLPVNPNTATVSQQTSLHKLSLPTRDSAMSHSLGQQFTQFPITYRDRTMREVPPPTSTPMEDQKRGSNGYSTGFPHGTRQDGDNKIVDDIAWLNAQQNKKVEQQERYPLRNGTEQRRDVLAKSNSTLPYSSPQTNLTCARTVFTTNTPNNQLPPQAETTTPRERLSGRKRDVRVATSTDNVNFVAGSVNDQLQPPKKKQKITYVLPHQNMEEGHFYVVLGEDVDVSTGRFKILSLLGEGTFGKVVEAWDRELKFRCAIKIVRNIPKYTQDATYEISYMNKINASDPRDLFAFVKLQRYFQNDGKHVCMVMAKYGPTLLDYLQKYGPFNHRCLAEMIYHAAAALSHIHVNLRHAHTDLKPENILLETGATTVDAVTGKTIPQLPCKIRLCDLGGCCDERHSKHAIVSTRHYRSPEVILGMGWMFSTDMWSMGCIIYELATGKLLYDTHDNLEHLHLMEKTLSRLPSEWSRLCYDEAKPLFSSNGNIQPLIEEKHKNRVSRARPIAAYIQDPLLLDLIEGLLQLDRSKRFSAKQTALHPYVRKYFPELLNEPNFQHLSEF